MRVIIQRWRWIGIWLISLGPTNAHAERVILKDGLELVGQVQSTEGQINVRTPTQWYTFSSDQLLRTEKESPAERAPEVYLFQGQPKKPNRKVDALSKVQTLDPFDSFGRRRVEATFADGKKLDVIQAVTEIHPTHIVIESIGLDWTSALSLSEITDDVLVSMLDQRTKDNNLEDHLKLIQFLIQSKRYSVASLRMVRARERFPAASSRIDLLQAEGQRSLLNDAQVSVERMFSAGRWEDARRVVDEMLRLAEGDSAGVWRRYQEKLDQLERDEKRARQILQQSLQQTSFLPSYHDEVRHEILGSTSLTLLDRLAPLLSLADQPDQTDKQRWSLAVSGWIAGPKLAQADVSQTERWLDRRKRLQRALRSASDEEFEKSLDDVRSAKIPADEAANLIRYLPAPPTTLEPGKVGTLQPARADSSTLGEVLVRLPTGYTPAGSYPLIVALHDSGSNLEEAIRFWEDAAINLHAILVAPEYLLDANKPYTYSLAEHERMLHLLAEVRRQLAVDPARAFLVGHGLGAMATYDLGWSHPDQWAGVVAIGGAPLFYMQYYWRNVRLLPTYVVDGQWGGKNPVVTRALLEQNWKRGDPVVSCIYWGRGPGRFPAERSAITDWMARQRRPAFPTAIEATSARYGDTRFYWAQIDTFLPRSTIAPTLFDQKKGLRPARIEGRVELGRSISVTSTGIDGLDLLLSPELVAMGDPNLEIRYQRKLIYQGPIASDVETMLREARRTGDRDRLIHHVMKLR
ncbi:hypothetical protein K2X85_16950 [bacterium]|nr:hypothetical protein [bacterium]